MKVTIGRVRANAKLVVHLSIGGDPCACGYKVNVQVGRAASGARLCKRGFTATRIAAAQQANHYANHLTHSFSAVAADILADVIQSRWTPEEKAASAAKIADYQAANAPAAPRRHRTWAEIRADLNRTPELDGQLDLLAAA